MPSCTRRSWGPTVHSSSSDAQGAQASPGSALAALTEGFRDAVVVVIGATGGIGSEVVRQLRGLGARVVAVSRRAGAERIDERAFSATGLAAVQADVGRAADRQRLAAQIGAAAGRIDVLVNTAGHSVQVPLREIERLSDELIDEVLHANAASVLATIRDLLPWLRLGRDPVIVNLGSVAARTGQGSNLAYVGAKAAVDAMSIGLAKALAPQVRVVGIAPSALDTGFVAGRGSDFIATTVAATPLRRLTTLPEVAAAVLCAARVLTATTGVVIQVDGGRHL